MGELLEFPQEKSGENLGFMISPESAFLVERASRRRAVSISRIEAGEIWTTPTGTEVTIPEGLVYLTLTGTRGEVERVNKTVRAYNQLLTDLEQFRNSNQSKS